MVAHSFILRIRSFLYRFSFWILTFCWSVGLLLGIITATKGISNLWANPLLHSRSSFTATVLNCCFFPFVISCACSRLGGIFLIYPLAAIKAFLFGYAHAWMYYSFGDAGWLVKALLFFSDTYLSIILLYCWFQIVSNRGKLRIRSVFRFAILGFFICVFDTLVIVPFLTRLL